jgi:hypothetical protein
MDRGIDEFKLKELKKACKKDGITVPNRKYIVDLLYVGYGQAGNYRKKLKDEQGVR